MKSGQILLGVLTGFALGATAGILFAPDKGSEIRNSILRNWQDYTDSLKDQVDALVANAMDIRDEASKDVDKFIEKRKNQYEDLKHEISNKVV